MAEIRVIARFVARGGNEDQTSDTAAKHVDSHSRRARMPIVWTL